MNSSLISSLSLNKVREKKFYMGCLTCSYLCNRFHTIKVMETIFIVNIAMANLRYALHLLRPLSYSMFENIVI